MGGALYDLATFLLAAAACVTALVLYSKRQQAAFAALAAENPDAPRPRGLLRRFVGPLAARLRPATADELEALQVRLLRAGRRARDEVDRFLEERVLFLLLFFFAGLLLAKAAGGGGGFFLFLVCLLFGVLLPGKLVDGAAMTHRNAVERGLPSAVDLLVTCLDAGLSLDKSIGRVGAELSHSDPVLADELKLTGSEFEAGVSLADALRRLSRRVGLDDLSALCAVIAQASALGAPIAQTLREYATSSRRQRISRLEERAGRLSTQLTIPLAVCLLPAALLIIMGPAIVQLMQALK
jgi:tight adherence protein C